MVAIPKISALYESSLASALSAAGTSFTVVSGTDRDNNALSGLYGFIIDEGSADEEFVVGTISGTTVTISARGLDADSAIVEVSANKKAHRRGASVKITDYPILSYLRNILNAETGYELPSHLKYASNTVFSDDEELVSKRYADSLANTGAANATTTVQGLVEEATQAEVEAGTATGGTGAKLFIPNDKNGAKLYFGYAADAGANDTYAITCSPVPTAYTTGMVIQFKANTVNTGACTLNVNSLGAKSLKVHKDLDPQDGYIKAGQIVTVVYDGTNFQILSVSGKPFVSQSGEEIYGASSSGNDTYAITVAPAPAAYVTGQRFYFKPDTANTGTATLNVNGLGAKTLKKFVAGGATALETGDILANQIVEVVYDGTDMIVVSRLGGDNGFYASGTTTKNAADASTTQTIAHGLGRTPKYVRIKASIVFTSASGIGLWSETVYNGTTQSSNSVYIDGATATVADSTFTLNIATGGGHYQRGVVTVDATNISIAWTKTSSPTGTYQILWEAFA